MFTLAELKVSIWVKMPLDQLVSIWKHIYMNTLELIRTDRGLTFEQLGELVGYDRATTWKHCHAEVIPAEAAIRYSAALGTVFSELRPDLPNPLCKTFDAENRENPS